jgi:hypothetical protein
MWRPAPTSPAGPGQVPPQGHRRRLTAPRHRRTLSKLASSMAHLTICQPPWRCTVPRKGCGLRPLCGRARRPGNAQPTCERAGQAGLGLVGFGPGCTSSPTDDPSLPEPSRRPTSVSAGQGPVVWAWLDLNQRPHPYQVSRAKRCAARRFPRSSPSVRAKGCVQTPRPETPPGDGYDSSQRSC